MGHVCFLVLVAVSGLLWTAACTAPAVRMRSATGRRALLAIGFLAPLLPLLPALVATSRLAADGAVPNWLGPVLALFLSLIIGGGLIARLGHGRKGAEPPARGWPVGGLCGWWLLATAAACGWLLALDSIVAADGRAMRAEAAMLRRVVTPATARLARDRTAPERLIELAETVSAEARLVADGGRRAAAAGRPGDAIAAVIRIGDLGRQLAAEPSAVTYSAATLVDDVALDLLAEALAGLVPADATRLDDPALIDMVATTPTALGTLIAEEAGGLEALADLAEGRVDPAAVAWRIFLFPADAAGFRSRAEQFRRLAELETDLFIGWSSISTGIDDVRAKSLRIAPDGPITRRIEPPIARILEARVAAAARRHAAEILLAITRRRLAGDGPVAEVADLVPAWLPVVPRDPFLSGEPLSMRVADGRIVVWSVGPDGADGGGPPGADDPAGAANDDIGLAMRIPEGQ